MKSNDGRSLALAVVLVGYVALAAVRAGSNPAGYAVLLLPVVLVGLWRATSAEYGRGDRAGDDARLASRAAFTGAAIVVASRAADPTPMLVALQNAGAAIASTGGLVAMARLSSLGGVLAPPATSRRIDAAMFAALPWMVAILLPAARAGWPERTRELDPAIVDGVTIAASLATLGVSLATAWRVRVTRRLELGAAERAGAALWLLGTALSVGLGAALLRVSRPESILPVLAATGSVVLGVSAVTAEPTTLARGLRIVVTAAGLATPLALAAVYAARAFGENAVWPVFAASLGAACAGLAAPRLAARFSGERARWLDAFERATRAAMIPDPDAALDAALLALRGVAGAGATDPALYHLGLPEVVTVDRAGYAHREKATTPDELTGFVEGEPERILRIEVVHAAQVRRPDVRGVAAWMDERGYAAIASVHDEMGPVGLLAVARGARRVPMTLDEVRALRGLCDRLGAVIGSSALLARSRARELAIVADLERARAELVELSAGAQRSLERLRAVAEMLARPVSVAAYSPAARGATDRIEHLANARRPVTLLSAPGIDVVAWSAFAHVRSPQRDGPLVVVDCASPTEHDPARWRDDASSPLAAARGGSLALVDAHALPESVQRYIAVALAEDVGIIVTVPSTVDALVAAGRMSEALADRLGDRAVALPTLAERAEDVRALAIEHLGRIGVRVQSRPLGIDPPALAALLEHTWPGNDAELVATLLRAALVAEGELVGCRDLERAGMPARPPPRSQHPPAELARKRARRA